MFPAVRGARQFKRHLAENAHRPGAGLEVLETALGFVEFADAQAA
jgi:tRNA-dihydrouridine synthase A